MADRTGASGPDGRGGVPSLPDFAGGSQRTAGAPGGVDGDGRAGSGADSGRAPGGGSGGGIGGPDGPHGGDPSGRGRGPLLALLGGVGCLVVVLAIVALVLSQTVFRGAPEEPPGTGGSPAGTGQEDPEQEDPEASPSPEFVPSQEAGDGEVTLAEQPTVECTTHENAVETEQVEGAVRGGGLEFTALEGWELSAGWGGSSAYTVDQSFAHQAVENGWYSLASVGAVEFPEDEGGYPGAQETARAIFQCALSRDDAAEIYGEPAQLADYRDEALEIDGHEAWIVGGDAQLEETALFHTTEAWQLVVIVVDTPEGPAVFHGGAARGHDQQVADLETMIESLRVL